MSSLQADIQKGRDVALFVSMRYGQIVMGPAGSGKSTYCTTIVNHCQASKRSVLVVNLDPAAEHFDYPIHIDVRELIHIEDVMEDEDIKLGPNGGLIFCMEYLVQHLDWLQQQLGDGEDDYFLFDCPGQIELYTHLPVMRQITDKLQQWNFRLCGVFLLDSQFLIETAKFFAGTMTALSAMVALELPHVNILSKMDLLDKKALKEVERYLDPDPPSLLADLSSSMSKKFHKLNKAITTVLSDYGLVQFMPLNISDEETIAHIVLYVDNSIQYGEDLDVHVPKLEADDVEDT